jgi:hypothetical protein
MVIFVIVVVFSLCEFLGGWLARFVEGLLKGCVCVCVIIVCREGSELSRESEGVLLDQVIRVK